MNILLLLTFCCIGFFAQANHSIIPEPLSYEEMKGTLITGGFHLKDNSLVLSTQIIQPHHLKIKFSLYNFFFGNYKI